MRTALTSLAIAVCLVVGSASGSVAADLGIVTGGENGIYYRFGLDLQGLARQSGISLSVYPSKGSIDNMYAVYQQPRTQLGIVQSDVLAFVGRVQSDPLLKRIASKTRMVFPLYDEEVHLLARGHLRDFDALANRRVAIGREGTGTYLTARLLFNLSDVAPREMVPLDPGEALAELKAGRIDAMLYVAGRPVKLFNQAVGEADGITLIPITNKNIAEVYPRAEIPANTYRWQPRSVETVAVKAVLISFDFRGRDCDNVGRLAKTLADNLDWLTKNGHPKWGAVDLDFSLEGWEQYDCVRKHLGKPAPAPAAGSSAGSHAGMEAVPRLLDGSRAAPPRS